MIRLLCVKYGKNTVQIPVSSIAGEGLRRLILPSNRCVLAEIVCWAKKIDARGGIRFYGEPLILYILTLGSIIW